MKLPDLIKQAVQEGDWKKVCAVYTAITGEPLAPPEPKKKELDLANFEITPELLQAIMGDENRQNEIKQAMIDEGDWEEEKVVENPPPKIITESSQHPRVKDANDFSVAPRVQRRQDGKQQARKEPMSIPKSRANRFQDNLNLESKDLKQNNPKLAAMYGDSASRRVLRDETESTGQNIHVECSLCGKEEVVASSLAIGYHEVKDENTYRCNSCNTPSGRRKAERRLRELETR